ncbi:hypothetical protein CSOJ01_13402 [Colletotrichum sojae]|uniref:Uncharacterized protein n=1 Tax=Colletotrichum sojae TaxID=2175907 RepID=A0A8H6ISH5_9PEZI|nr:hypothetical protein CSOJ01_13402 [Colletotrichum sojae]
MSFFQGDSRPGEQPAPPPRALTPVEIGVIIGTITVFLSAIGSLFFYRNRKAKQRRGEVDTMVSRSARDHDGNNIPLHPGGHHKNDDESSREADLDKTPPSPPREKKTWKDFGDAKAYEADRELST